MEIKKLSLGKVQTNCYILIKNNNCIVIDPASNFERIKSEIGELTLQAIILTHGHFDHLLAADKLVNYYHVDLYLNENDLFLATDEKLNSMASIKGKIFTKPKNLDEGNLTIGDFNFEVISAPGHTPGSMLLIIEENLFAGDVLFKDSIGRYDFPYSSISDTRKTVRMLKELDSNLTVYPGHGPITSLKREFEYNMFLK